MGFDVEEYSKQRKKQQTTNAGSGGFDVEAYSKSRYAPQAGEEILSRVNKWLKKNEEFINSYNTRYGENSTSYRADSADWLSSVTSQSSDLEKEANEIKSLLQQYQDFFSSDFVGSINSAINPSLSLQNKILSNSTKDHEYWSQWENEGAYKRDMADWLEDKAEVNAEKVSARQEIYQSNAARIKELEDKYEGTGWRLLDDLLHGFFRNTEEEEGEYYEGMDELERLRAENTRYEREQRELDNYFVPETEEFLQNAAYRDYSNSTIKEIDAYSISLGYTDSIEGAGGYQHDGAWYDKDGNIIEIDNDAKEPVVQDKLAFYLNNRNGADYVISDHAFNFVNQYMVEGSNGSWEELKDEEINIYYDLYKREGQQAAYDFLDAMKTTLNKRATQTMADEVSKAELGSFEQIFYNAASVPANIFGGAAAFVDDTINILQGEDINPYSSAHSWQNFAQAVREDTASDIVKATGGAALPLVGTTWGDAYQALMSGVDSLVGSALGGTTYGILMGMGAASSEAKELYEKGASLDQIAAGGIFAGAAEMVFEKFSIDKFVKMGDTKTLKTLVINTLKQGGVEASEEMLTEIANTITDAAVMGSQSDLQGYVDQYIAQGYSESEAVVKALFNDVAANVLNAGISGFLSGGGMGSLGSIGSYAKYQGQVKAHGQSIIKEGGVDTLKALALEMAGVKDSTNAKSIGKLASKVASKASAKNVGRLSAAIGDTVSTQNKSDVQNALTEKGLSKKDAARVAEYLTSNEVLSEEQKAEIDGNEKVAEVVKELVENKNSVVNQRKLNLLAARLGVDIKNSTINGKSTSVNGVSLKNEIDVTGKVSEEGKTTKVSTGEVITIDKNNAIAKTKVVDGERVVYYNTDHGVVEASDVSYASKEDGLLFESFSDMNPAFANAAIKNYDGSVPVQTYIDGMREGMILYGMHNFQAVGKDISRNSDFAELSEADQAFALKLGRAYANANVKKSETAMKTAIKNAAEKAGAEGDTSAVRKKGSVRLENGAKATTKAQRKAVALAKHLSKAIGIDIVFYDARYTTDKHGKGSNGYFDSKTNSIRLDLQKAATDTKTIAFTLSHEMVHFIKKWSPAKFNTFAKFLMEQYAAHGVSTSTLLANKMAQLGETNADKAYEEMICDACERMLLDSNAVMKLMELRKADLELFEKIKLHILEILNNIRESFKGVDPNTDEGKALQKMEDVLGKLHEMFEDAAVDAVQNYQAHTALNTEYVSVSEDGTIQMQMKQYQQTGRSTLLSYLKEQYGDNNANDLIATIDSIYNVMAEIKEDTALSVFGNWQDTDVELDANGHPIFTTSINNGDYELNQDFSRVCKKRRQLNFVLNMLAEDPAFEASNLTKDDFVKINKAIKEHGFEIACALCFVDSKRFRQTEWADSFANTWNDILGSMKADSKPLSRFNFATKSVNMADEGIQIDPSKPISYRKWSNGKATETRHYENLDDLLAKDGNNNVKAIARLLRDNPNLRHEFRGADIIASDGFDSIQRLAPDVRGILDGWGGSSVPKPSSNDAIYDNSILNIDGYNAEKAFAVGGVRMNSFSDFMAHMFFDYAQAFADLSAKKLPMHSYTKELDFARLFGLTGGKINMSAIAAIRKGAANIDKIKAKADKEAATDYEKSIAGLDISRLAEKLGKSESDITYDDVIQNLDDVDYVWADESVDVKSATLLQSGILYDKLTEGQAAYCYELIRNGQMEEAFRIAGEENVNRGYAKHLGIITVGVSKAHILKLLRDPTIRMVIPYHKSGLNPAVAKALNIAFYDDFTDVQNTIVRFKGGDQFGISSDSSKIGGKKLQDFSFYDFFGKTIDGVLYDGKATAAKYIEWCEKGFYDETVGDYVYYLNGGGYILASELRAKGIEVKPKFYEFASEENYYKLVEDFDCYDTITGEHSAQEAVDLFHDGLPSDYKDVLTKALKAEQKVSDDFRDHLDNKGLRDEIMAIAGKHGYTPSEASKDDGVKKQQKSTGRISVGMSDTERSEILKGKNIISPIYEGQADALIAEKKTELESRKKEFARAAILEIAEKLEIVGKEINFNDVEVKILLSKSNLRESMSKEATPEQIAKLLPVLPTTAENSVVIERHDNRYYFDTDTVYFDNLMGAYVDGDLLVPVRFGLKHSRTGATTLYVVVDQNKVALENLGETKKDRGLQDASPAKAESDSLRRSVTYSISQIIPFVKSKDLLRYLPDDMLDGEQKKLKWEGIAETIKRTNDKNDKKYKEYIESGNLVAAQQMVKAAAKAAGYTVEGWHGTRNEFTVFDINRSGKNYDGWSKYGKGVYFTTTEDGAYHWAGMAKGLGDMRVMHTYLRMENPFVIKASEYISIEDMLGKMDKLADFAKEHRYDGIKSDSSEQYVVFDPNQIKSADTITYDKDGNIIPLSERFNSENDDIRYQKKTSYAPTFYSQMGKVIDDIKMEKVGAASVLNYIKGKGIKNEEIKWSGIEAFLEGKKSVTKKELQEFVAGSMLQIEEESSVGGDKITLEPSKYGGDTFDIMSGGKILDTVTWNKTDELFESDSTGLVFLTKEKVLRYYQDHYEKGGTRWSEYKLDGGSNYRELVFKLPNSSYSNTAMRGHWGEDAEGVLAHARLQDMTTSDGKKMLFIEEIQSDWHNAGQKHGYRKSGEKTDSQIRLESDEAYEKFYNSIEEMLKARDYDPHPAMIANLFYGDESAMSFISSPEMNLTKDELAYIKSEVDKEAERQKAIPTAPRLFSAPDAPFRDTYHEYVLKRLLRIAAEEGYDSIGWTTADMQSERWSSDFAEGYRIEYDQDMPKFLRKYGKKWGATVEKTALEGLKPSSETLYDVNRQETYKSMWDWETAVKKDLRGQGLSAREANSVQFKMDGEYVVAYGADGVEYDRAKVTTTDNKVWSMDITDSMKESVLNEGQPLYQKKQTSNRELLANALESTAQNDIEKNKLAQYKSKIDLIESEQAKLAEVRAEANELRFTKGRTPEETKRMKSLDFEANQIANRINTYDRQLLNLESTTALKNVLQREKKMAYKRAEQKGKEALRKAKEKRDETIRTLMTKNREARERGIERRKMSDVRDKIKNFKQKLESALQHPTDKQYVPVNLVQAMVDVCSLIDTDTALYKEDGSINKAQERRNATKEKLQSLKDEYENLKTNADPMYKEEFDEAIYKYLQKLRIDFEGKSLSDMTLSELEEMYDILKSINETLKEARKLIGWGDASDVYEAGDAIIEEQNAITKGRKNEKRSAAQKATDRVEDLSLSPVRNVERMSGYREDSPLLKLFKRFEVGVRKKNKFLMESHKMFEALTTGENAKVYEDAIYNEYGSEYTDVNGRKFKVSKMMMMQAVMSYERETANKMHHIAGSGFTFADLDLLRKGKLREAISEEYSHRMTIGVEMAGSFVKALENDTWAQDYMAMARQFFDGKAKDAVNETYITLKHRIIARDKKYIPFEVDKNFVVREISAANDIQQTINSYGMLQETKDGASQPLIITGLNNILERHIDQVGNVYGLAVPIRNFNKVWNVRAVDSGYAGDPTVQAAIERNWGIGGKKFITQTVQDLQGSRPNAQSDFYRWVKSNYIGSTFLLNLSVVTKQIGSLFASTSMLRWRDPARMVGNLVYTMANSKKISEEVDKYTAAIWMRRQGLSDAELSTLATEAKKSGIAKVLNKLPAAINPAKWIAGMDSMVALSLWKYAKEDTAKRTGLTGEELLKATAEFFDEVIENTQSMTDVLHRPEIQKRQDVLSEAFGMFKTDLYQMAGQLQVSLGRYQHNKTKENGKALARTVYSITMSAVWGSLMTTLFALLRYKVDPYRDDEDEELTAESWLKRQGVGLAGDIVGYIFPLAGSEFVGFIENIMYGESDDIVDSLALTLMNDLYSTMITVGNSIKEGEMPSEEAWQKLVVKSLQVFGAPSNNILRTVNAIKLHAKDIANGEFLSFEAGKDKTNAKALYDAIMSGNSDRIKEAESKFDDQPSIESAIRGELRSNDPRVKKAAHALNSGDIRGYTKYLEDIAAEGHFEKELIEGAIRSEKSSFNSKISEAAKYKTDGKDKEYKDIVVELRESYRGIYSQDEIISLIKKAQDEHLDKDDDDDLEEATSIFRGSDINDAFDSGDTDLAVKIIDDLVKVKTENNLAKAKREAEDNGKTFNERKAREEAESQAKSSVKSSITSHWKPIVIEAFKSNDTAEQLRIRDLLFVSGLYGKTRKEVFDIMKDWYKEKD